MNSVPREVVEAAIAEAHIPDFGRATIREVVQIANAVEERTGVKYVRMEMGVPGLPADSIGVEAERRALAEGCAQVYPPLPGVPRLKQAAAKFAKAFMDIDIPARNCIPVSGSMQGVYASFVVCGQSDKRRDTILFVDPGFPVQKTQADVIGLKHEAFDIFDCRGEALIAEVEGRLAKGNICAVLYGNPNNPSWMCLTEEEIAGLCRVCRQHDVVIIEDLAYFGMDFRVDISHPGEPPYQPTALKCTGLCVALVSGSKAFSYAGQRIGCALIGDELWNRAYPDLGARYGIDQWGPVYVNRILYTLSSGTAHSAQHALAAMFEAAVEGRYNFLQTTHEYERRARALKAIFQEAGFSILYNDDQGQQAADGFYFTVCYPGMTGAELMRELLFHGIAIISLDTTGSQQQGLRVCVSFVPGELFPTVRERLLEFRRQHQASVTND